MRLCMPQRAEATGIDRPNRRPSAPRGRPQLPSARARAKGSRGDLLIETTNLRQCRMSRHHSTGVAASDASLALRTFAPLAPRRTIRSSPARRSPFGRRAGSRRWRDPRGPASGQPLDGRASRRDTIQALRLAVIPVPQAGGTSDGAAARTRWPRPQRRAGLTSATRRRHLSFKALGGRRRGRTGRGLSKYQLTAGTAAAPERTPVGVKFPPKRPFYPVPLCT